MIQQLVLAPKPHFLAAFLMFVLIAWMAVEESKFTRGMLIAPVFLLFFCFLVLYGMEVSLILNSRQGGSGNSATGGQAGTTKA